jgi:hypothetical protein
MVSQRKFALLPLVASLLFVLAGCGSGSMSSAMPNPQMPSVGLRTDGGRACQPDFTLAVTPTSATITSGQSVTVTAELASVCGLAGTINVGIRHISPPPNGSNGFTIKQPRYDIPLKANGTAVAPITLGATPATLKTTYTITIRGEDISGGCCYGIKHSAIFVLTVK